ncbi:MAG: nucleotide sugar dehydrogenase [Nostocales cyanobacterium 94392]|nr:nucleotide sugar dehydrogenase [Nostocales cyanobacterium 94392]
MNINKIKIAVIGLGYVGLPLAVAFSDKYEVVGVDINEKRIKELQEGYDTTLEVMDSELQLAIVNGFKLTTAIEDAKDCTVFIVTVPTPTDKHNRPVLTPMVKASEAIASVLKLSDVIIYESTVYPGVTEDEMVPVLERVSGLTFNTDFFVGYSPERINPGDKEHTVTKILKVTSGSTPEAAEFVDQLYKSIITAGTHKASSIKVAEAAKVIENSQRDINIAFVNELSKIFGLLGIDTLEVLEAAGTKWNFLKFKPGLVGGHCIGVDPYYLAQKAQEVGYHPEIILAGRRLNDSMGKHVATEVVKLMMRKDLKVIDSKVLILGFTFKEDCPDVRNTRVIDIYQELKNFDIQVDVYDPWANPEEVMHEYGVTVVNRQPTAASRAESRELRKSLPTPNSLLNSTYSAAILAVSHKEFADLDIRAIVGNGVVFDVKGVLPKELVDARL